MKKDYIGTDETLFYAESSRLPIYDRRWRHSCVQFTSEIPIDPASVAFN